MLNVPRYFVIEAGFEVYKSMFFKSANKVYLVVNLIISPWNYFLVTGTLLMYQKDNFFMKTIKRAYLWGLQASKFKIKKVRPEKLKFFEQTILYQ